MTERERLLRRIATCDFAVVELHIYLDTHPNDQAAMAKLDEYLAKSNALRNEFIQNFGAIRASDTNAWDWISNPWPWDNTEEGV